MATPDISATVEAGITSTKEAEASIEATVTAELEATKAAEKAPTPTPRRMPTAIPTPTETPRPTTTEAPNQTEIRDSAGRLYDCLQKNVEMKRLFLQGAVLGVTAEGVSEESATGLAEVMMSSKEMFILSFLEAGKTDPWILESMEFMLELCPAGSETGQGGSTIPGETPPASSPTPVSEEERLIALLFRCYQNPEFAALTGLPLETFAPLLEDWDSFRIVMGLAFQEDPSLLAAMLESEFLLSAMCGSE